MNDSAQEKIVRRWRQAKWDMDAALANLKRGRVRTRPLNSDTIDQDIAKLEDKIAEFQGRR